jgi:hypothetical protein
VPELYYDPGTTSKYKLFKEAMYTYSMAKYGELDHMFKSFEYPVGLHPSYSAESVISTVAM